VMSATERDHLVGNIVWHLSQGVERSIQERAVKSYWYPIDPDLGVRVAKGLALESLLNELLAAR
jgi:catalase